MARANGWPARTYLAKVGPILLGDGAVRLEVGLVPYENHRKRFRVFDPQDLRVEPLDLIEAADRVKKGAWALRRRGVRYGWMRFVPRRNAAAQSNTGSPQEGWGGVSRPR